LKFGATCAGNDAICKAYATPENNANTMFYNNIIEFTKVAIGINAPYTSQCDVPRQFMYCQSGARRRGPAPHCLIRCRPPNSRTAKAGAQRRL